MTTRARGSVLKLRRQFHVFDYMTAAQIADVQSFAFTSDVTTAVQSAIDAMPAWGGDLVIPGGGYRISTTISVPKAVRLVGEGGTEDMSAVSGIGTYGSRFAWYGAGGGTMMTFGGNGGPMFAGGGIENLAFDGRSIAGRCLLTKDVDRAFFTRLTMRGATIHAWDMGSTGTAFATGFFVADDIRILLRAMGCDSANGINISGTSTGGFGGGVTISHMRRIRIDHANGAAVRIDGIGDAFEWDHLYSFRADAETGAGVQFTNAVPANAANNHVFINPLCSGGFRFDNPGVSGRTNLVFGMHQSDINAPGFPTMYGAGVGDAYSIGSLGWNEGLGLFTPNKHNILHSDGMQFFWWDNPNSRVYTREGLWHAPITGSGASITSAGANGSAIRLATTGFANTIVHLFDSPAPGTEGVIPAHSPYISMNVGLVGITNVRYRMGWANGTGDNPTNGIWFEYDPASSAFLKLVAVKAGVRTEVVTTFSVFAVLYDWHIYRSPGGFGAAFYQRVANNKNIGCLGTIAEANLPTVALSAYYQLKATNTTFVAMDLYNHKLGHWDECLAI